MPGSTSAAASSLEIGLALDKCEVASYHGRLAHWACVDQLSAAVSPFSSLKVFALFTGRIERMGAAPILKTTLEELLDYDDRADCRTETAWRRDLQNG